MTTTRMNLGVAALALTALGATGCASIKSPPMEVDAAYVAYVEAAAKRYSTQVIWVNPPMRPARAQDADKAEPAKR